MSLPKRIGIIVAVGLFVLAAAVVVVFAIGKPTTTPVSPEAAAPAEVASLETAGEAGSDPLAVRTMFRQLGFWPTGPDTFTAPPTESSTS